MYVTVREYDKLRAVSRILPKDKDLQKLSMSEQIIVNEYREVLKEMYDRQLTRNAQQNIRQQKYLQRKRERLDLK